METAEFTLLQILAAHTGSGRSVAGSKTNQVCSISLFLKLQDSRRPLLGVLSLISTLIRILSVDTNVRVPTFAERIATSKRARANQRDNRFVFVLFVVQRQGLRHRYGSNWLELPWTFCSDHSVTCTHLR